MSRVLVKIMDPMFVGSHDAFIIQLQYEINLKHFACQEHLLVTLMQCVYCRDRFYP